jgi:hypothetical protein
VRVPCTLPAALAGRRRARGSPLALGKWPWRHLRVPGWGIWGKPLPRPPARPRPAGNGRRPRAIGRAPLLWRRGAWASPLVPGG